MTKGKASVDYLGRSGVVTPQTAPSWDFIYEASLVKQPKYELGDRVVLPDGREFHYAKSSGACWAGRAVQFDNTGFQGWGSVAVSQVVGDKQVTITGGGHAIVAKDELRGGYMFIADPTVGFTDRAVQFRGIIGNLAAGLNKNVTIYLDGPLTNAITATVNACEVFKSPYSAVQLAFQMEVAAKGKPGVAATYVSAANMYFWIQTKGPTWVGSKNNLIKHDIGGVWRHDGSLEGMSAIIGDTLVANPETSQYAGYSMVGNNAGNGPLFMLQG